MTVTCDICGSLYKATYKKATMLCPRCKDNRRNQQSRDNHRAKTLKKKLDREVDKWKVKQITHELEAMLYKHNIDRDELERIFLTYVGGK